MGSNRGGVVGKIRNYKDSEIYQSGIWNIRDVYISSISSAIALYDFTKATFTPGGQIGASGPSLGTARSGLNVVGDNTWIYNSSFFNTVNGSQIWTAPVSGLYRITTSGAAAKNRSGGDGAIVSGTFNLVGNEQIQILVGQRPSPYTSANGSGAGGTFVVKYKPSQTISDILLIAGGGGGAHDIVSMPANSKGSTGTSGNPATTGGAGGSLGSGGGVSQGSAGAGFSGNGISTYGGVDALSFLNGGIGGSLSGYAAGFGGGGRHGNSHGGGGGGYSGGGGSSTNPWAGGGGGSFVSKLAIDPATSNGVFNILGEETDVAYTGSVSNLNLYNSQGDGSVVIEKI